MSLVKRYNYSSQFGPDVRDLISKIESLIINGNYILGEAVTQFESDFASYIGADYCVGVNSGTDALIISLMALGVGPGDEVVTQANTFYATVAAICIVGATPVLTDADPKTYLMDVSMLERAITAKTKAIIPVHLFGKCMNMEQISSIARKYNLKIVEDAAQSHGARINGQSAGTFGHTGCFSFHPSKNLAAAGDGGAIATNDCALAKQVKIIRSLGQYEQNDHITIGINSKLDTIQAKVLSWKLPNLEYWNSQRRRIATIYRKNLSHLPVSFQSIDNDLDHVYHLFQLQSEHRDDLLAFLISHGVDAIVRYPTPIHRQRAFEKFSWYNSRFPVAEHLAASCLCLPIRPDMSDEEVMYVCDCTNNFFGNKK
ncbi:MAG: Aminotransferase, DegT/DnrJ/EryC1/StrS family [uncultured Caballeronia sp.]|nr:MAG: Aminotransferase, DegT/DnrJ/EryC1/StrS family [uncultured Caballeronia sp.]